ncbi:MAG: hypothetical protein EZS28_030451 [Streblomastix strix]|uniref:Transmembrane protein n=1 Tax=Streblomastix strix TaxID=222440 RepID=A0A5J4UVB0_9EUKA|nr:MAG: hypothetical protein EZS28_030451 [Streblomastix strix]
MNGSLSVNQSGHVGAGEVVVVVEDEDEEDDDAYSRSFFFVYSCLVIVIVYGLCYVSTLSRVDDDCIPDDALLVEFGDQREYWTQQGYYDSNWLQSAFGGAKIVSAGFQSENDS